MPDTAQNIELCNCLALREAARHVTQFYDHLLAEIGLRVTQYSILRKLERRGAATINALADDLVMDRTTLSRNLHPLQRAGWIANTADLSDARATQLRLTKKGAALLRAADKQWSRAQASFDKAFGADRAVQLRRLMSAVVSTDF